VQRQSDHGEKNEIRDEAWPGWPPHGQGRQVAEVARQRKKETGNGSPSGSKNTVNADPPTPPGLELTTRKSESKPELAEDAFFALLELLHSRTRLGSLNVGSASAAWAEAIIMLEGRRVAALTPAQEEIFRYNINALETMWLIFGEAANAARDMCDDFARGSTASFCSQRIKLPEWAEQRPVARKEIEEILIDPEVLKLIDVKDESALLSNLCRGKDYLLIARFSGGMSKDTSAIERMNALRLFIWDWRILTDKSKPDTASASRVESPTLEQLIKWAGVLDRRINKAMAVDTEVKRLYHIAAWMFRLVYYGGHDAGILSRITDFIWWRKECAVRLATLEGWVNKLGGLGTVLAPHFEDLAGIIARHAYVESGESKTLRKFSESERRELFPALDKFYAETIHLPPTTVVQAPAAQVSASRQSAVTV